MSENHKNLEKGIIKNNKTYLLGLDFGSTTSSALVAETAIVSNTATGQMEFGKINIIYRSDITLTPFLNNEIDINEVSKLISKWIEDSNINPINLFAGGVIITGLAARKENAQVLIDLIKKEIGEILIATADDPRLESWLAFMGCCSSLSKMYKNKYFLNLDVGGGTTNPAIGLNGNVVSTGCYFIGARHFQFVPGSYKIINLTNEAKKILSILNIFKKELDILSKDEVDKIIGWYILGLEAICQNNHHFFNGLKEIVQYPLDMNLQGCDLEICFSGGVGMLIYQLINNIEISEDSYFGDLGIDLAKAIIKSPILSVSLKRMIPENQGRATVYGLALHSTEISGTTLYSGSNIILPLQNLPIIAQINSLSNKDEWDLIISKISQYPRGCCIQIIHESLDYTYKTIKGIGEKIAFSFKNNKFSTYYPIVILINGNIGKTLGNYACEWNAIPVNLLVIDEINIRNANFVNIGKMHQQIIPVSFYGIQ